MQSAKGKNIAEGSGSKRRKVIVGHFHDGERDLQSGQDLRRQQFEAGASVDQNLGDLEVVDDGRHE